MEAVNYVELNKFGSAVVAGTGIHVTAIGFAYEGGYTEQELLEWFNLSKEQLFGVLAYFYRHRDNLISQESEAAKLAQKLAQNGLEKLREQRKRKSVILQNIPDEPPSAYESDSYDDYPGENAWVSLRRKLDTLSYKLSREEAAELRRILEESIEDKAQHKRHDHHIHMFLFGGLTGIALMALGLIANPQPFGAESLLLLLMILLGFTAFAILATFLTKLRT